MKAYFVPTLKEGEKIFGIDFKPAGNGIKQGEYNGIPVFVTGITKTSAAFSAALIIKEFGVTEAVLTGICGAYRSSGLFVGDVVSIYRDFFADEAVFYNDRIVGLGEIGLDMPSAGASEYLCASDLPIVNSNTVSFLDGEGEISSMLAEKTGAGVENMEGAAFGYVCNMLGVKAYQIRAVSNFCGSRQDQEWDIKKAFVKLKSYYENSSLY